MIPSNPRLKKNRHARPRFLSGTSLVLLGALAVTPPVVQANTPPPTALFTLAAQVSPEFGRILKKSELRPDDLKTPYTTFLVPEDGACARENPSFESMDQKSARRFVLEHAFPGQVAFPVEDTSPFELHYFPHPLSQTDGMKGRVTIDASHSMKLQSMTGTDLTAAVAGRQVTFGRAQAASKAPLTAPDGAIVVVDRCNLPKS